jgi:hypothetical protein
MDEFLARWKRRYAITVTAIDLGDKITTLLNDFSRSKPGKRV